MCRHTDGNLITVESTSLVRLSSASSSNLGAELASATPLDTLTAAAYCADVGKLAVAAGCQVPYCDVSASFIAVDELALHMYTAVRPATTRSSTRNDNGVAACLSAREANK